MGGIAGGGAEGTFKSIKEWADFIDMFEVNKSSANHTVVMFSTHLLFV